MNVVLFMLFTGSTTSVTSRPLRPGIKVASATSLSILVISLASFPADFFASCGAKTGYNIMSTYIENISAQFSNFKTT